MRLFAVDSTSQPLMLLAASFFSLTFGNPALKWWFQRVSHQECRYPRFKTYGKCHYPHLKTYGECRYPRLRTCNLDGGWSRTQVRRLPCTRWCPPICLTASQPIVPSKAPTLPSDHRHLTPLIRTCGHHRSKLVFQTCASSLPIAVTSHLYSKLALISARNLR